MELTKQQQEKLKNLDLVEASRKARKESNKLINDQFFSFFTISISNFIAERSKHPKN